VCVRTLSFRMSVCFCVCHTNVTAYDSIHIVNAKLHAFVRETSVCVGVRVCVFVCVCVCVVSV
jgi:hypothetical protein